MKRKEKERIGREDGKKTFILARVKQYKISVTVYKINNMSIGHVVCLSHAKQEHKRPFRISFFHMFRDVSLV